MVKRAKLWEERLENQGDLGQVVGEEYKEALKVDPGVAEIHLELGNALFSKGLIDEAMKEYKEAPRINPEEAAAHNNLGIILGDRGMLDESIIEE